MWWKSPPSPPSAFLAVETQQAGLPYPESSPTFRQKAEEKETAIPPCHVEVPTFPVSVSAMRFLYTSFFIKNSKLCYILYMQSILCMVSIQVVCNPSTFAVCTSFAQIQSVFLPLMRLAGGPRMTPTDGGLFDLQFGPRVAVQDPTEKEEHHWTHGRWNTLRTPSRSLKAMWVWGSPSSRVRPQLCRRIIPRIQLQFGFLRILWGSVTPH